MLPGRWKDLVAAASLVAALAFGGWLLLRSRGALDSSWTDGTSRYPSETGAKIRHAVWAPAERLAGIEGEAGDPTLSPDGRLLVFSAGERGLNGELYVAELIDGVAGEAEPLGVLDTSHDELAPAFGAGALYFASDRPGGMGGLDLWRAPYADGEFGPPEPLAAGLNSAADETDPAPLADGGGLFFSSDRARGMRTDFDLYRASADGSGRYGVEPLAGLNTTFDEREPALSPDQRSLYFASDRDGPFALLRTIRAGDRWDDPAPVPGLAAPRPQRGPWVSADGFALLFDAENGRGERELLRARSLELFLVPPPGVSLGEWLLLGAFLLLALLALLARRWQALDILLKCFLASLIVHLLLLLYMRTVHPGNGATELQGEDGPTFRVRLEPESAAPAPSTLEARLLRGAESAPERVPFAPDSARAAAPEVAALSLPEAVPPSAPAPRSTAPPAPDRSAAARLAQPDEPAELYAAAATTLALPAPDPAPPAPSGSPTLARAEEPRAEIARARPTPAADMPRVATQGIEDVAPARERIEPTSATTPDVALAGPAETLSPSAARAAELALAPAQGAATRETPVAAVERPSFAAEGPPPAVPLASTGRFRAPPAADASAASPAPVPDSGIPPALATSSGAPALRAPAADGTRAAAAPAPAFDAGSGLGEAPARPARAGAAPERLAAREDSLRAPMDLGPDAQPLPAPPSELALAPRAMEPSTASAHATAPAGARANLRSPAEESATAPRAAPAPDFALDSGTRASPARSREAAAPAPERLAAREDSTRVPMDLGPDAQPLPAPPSELALAPRAMEPSTASAPATAPAGARANLRGPAEKTAPPPLAAPAPDLALDSGTRASPARSREAAAPAPERARLEDSAEAQRLAARPLALAAPPVPLPEIDRSPPRLPDTPYQNRFGQQKLRALEEFGGSEETEHAVALGLAYLAGIQERDGAWGQRSDAHEKYLDVRVGKTGLALLAFLGAGHVPAGNTEHATVAERAVRFLLGVQDEESGHLGRSCSYGHGIATYALAECFALTQDERLRAPLEHAVAEILANQARGNDPERAGGWGYYYADDHVWNGDTWPRTSVTAWQVMALESATLGGLAVPEQAFQGARSFLLNAWDPGARAFRYDHDPERLTSGYPILPASTPAALFALALLDVDPTHAELAQARRFVLARAPDGYRYTGDTDFVQRARGNLYFWYYATLAMFRVGGTEWERWNAALKETLLPAQDEDGSWRPIDSYSEYAGDEDGERTYSTAMCVLSLEIYYRYFTPLLRVK